MTITSKKYRALWAITALSLAASLSACAPKTGTEAGGTEPAENAAPTTELGISDADYSLDALIEAAKKEGPITVVDATGKIEKMAENFTAKYGIEATGVKMSAQEQEEVIIREAQAQNVKSDVFNMSNLPDVTSQIIPEGIGVSWLPPDLKDVIPTEYQNPAITENNPWVFAYNNEVNDTCPVNNVWALTTPEWTGKFVMPDPLLRNETLFWFNQMSENGEDEMKAAYKEQFGKEFTGENATKEWVTRLAANSPNVVKSDTDAGPIIGAAGQANPPMGFLSTSIFRDAKEDNLSLGLCDTMKPWIGQLTPRVAIIAAGTKHPNASKLFVHFMMTQEGMQPQLNDGKISTNTEAEVSPEEASGIANHLDKMYVNNSDTTKNDYHNMQDWRDLWTINKK